MKKLVFLLSSIVLMVIGTTSCSNDDKGTISSADFEKNFIQGGWQESKIYKIESSGQWTEIEQGIGYRPLRFAFSDWNLLKLYHEYDHAIHGKDDNSYFEEYDYCNYQYKESTQELTFSNSEAFYNTTYHVESISPEKLVIKGKDNYDNNMYVHEFNHVPASVVKEWDERFVHEKR